MKKKIRSLNNEIPVILMGYYNLIYQSGENNFLNKCKKTGVDGIIVVDLPYPENKKFAKKCKKKSINFVQLLSPTTTKERIKKIASVGRGALLAKERQKNHLKNATQALAKISGNDLEIISIHVRDALLSIDSLTNETDNEDILGIIFSKFCIGK